MKNQSFRLPCVLALGVFAGACAFAQTPPPNPCTAPASWFPHSQTPAPNPNMFPGANATNCDFHQWSWQMFLWLTQDWQGQLRFLSFPTDTDLFDATSPAKTPLSLAALNARTTKPRVRLKLRGLKPMNVGATRNDPHRVIQASGGIIV